MPGQARRGRRHESSAGDRRSWPWCPWALLLALPVGLAVSLPLVFGLHLPGFLVVPVAIVIWLLWAVVAHGALVRAATSGRSILRYWAGLGAALAVAFVVAVTGVAASWDHDVAARRSDTSARDRWTARFESLVAERRTHQQELDTRAPDVERDETVIRLEQRLAQVTIDLDGADKAVVCERDGTCGTGIRGAGPNYREKVRARDDLRREFAALPDQLGRARAAVEAKADEIDRKKPSADAAVERIKVELAELGQRPPEPPGQMAAMSDVAGDHLPGMLIVFALVTGLLLLDLVAALPVVGYRKRANQPSTRDLVRERSVFDLADGPGGAT